jgi:hypothetical protein
MRGLVRLSLLCPQTGKPDQVVGYVSGACCTKQRRAVQEKGEEGGWACSRCIAHLSCWPLCASSWESLGTSLWCAGRCSSVLLCSCGRHGIIWRRSHTPEQIARQETERMELASVTAANCLACNALHPFRTYELSIQQDLLHQNHPHVYLDMSLQ